MSPPRLLVAVVTVAGVATALILSPAAGAAPPPKQLDLSSAFNIDCVAAQYLVVVEGDCLGSGRAPTSSPGATFITGKFPSGTITVAGIPFTFGTMTGGAANAAFAAGQVVKVAAPASGLAWAHLVVVAVNGSATGSLTITYTNGASTRSRMTSVDWTASCGTSPAAIAAPYQALIKPAGTALSPGSRYVCLQSIPLNPRRAVSSLTFNVEGGANLRVFAVTLAAKAAGKAVIPWTPPS